MAEVQKKSLRGKPFRRGTAYAGATTATGSTTAVQARRTGADFRAGTGSSHAAKRTATAASATGTICTACPVGPIWNGRKTGLPSSLCGTTGSDTPGQPVQASQPMPQPIQFHQPVHMPQQPVYGGQWQQPVPAQPQNVPVQAAPGDNGNREYRSQPQPAEMYSFDKDDECDRELLREDPYAEYLDFPEEYRMKDEAQMETVCC